MDVIDRVMTRFGFPVGPFTLLDEVGIDVGAKAGKVMHRPSASPADVRPMWWKR